MKNLLILTYWSYKDALIQTYTLPYVRIIKKNLPENSKIYLFTMEQDFFKMSKKDWQNEKSKLKEENIYLIRFGYSKFGVKMAVRFLGIFISLFFLILRKEISHIHAWCTPAGAIGYVLSVFTFKPLVIDSYEPHAEALVENGEWTRKGKSFRILFWFEKRMSRKAKTVIALTQGMKDYAKQKYNAEFDHYYVKPALVDLQKFNPQNQLQNKILEKHKLHDKIVCLYAGKFGGIYLEKEVFELLKVAYNYWGEKFRVLLLTNTSEKEIFNQAKKFNLPEEIFVVLFVNHNEIEEYFKLADFAINPVKPVPTKKYCTSIKDGEYWAMGLPVIITKNISDDSNIIEKENIGAVINELCKEEYRIAIKKIDDLLKEDKEVLQKKIRAIAIKYRSFTIAEKVYKEMYEGK
jgi:Glycosyl transferases group 1